ncbi:MAG: UDP-N-acetylglucosamine 2-epimerase (non-hydrolyzing) [Desulfobacterales bacterium]|nr:UDP-N-acetylglucosamine 2-epimerase (non-hydrolyzing) [Desulfobacterales bacterium]
MKIVTIVGARPQFIKAAPVSRALREAGHTEFLVHTGQHYDENMSQVFFEELNIPTADYNLSVCNLAHGAMTGRMLEKIEDVLLEIRPDCVLVYGDTNSTLAGALAAKKLYLKLAHVEAGLRSFNMEMPEEQNRVVADRLSDLLFCPTETAVSNLKKEGIANSPYGETVINVGDVMYDALLFYSDIAEKRASILDRLQIERGQYVLSTIHRAENTDVPARLDSIMLALREIANEIAVILPLHPRTMKILLESTQSVRGIKIIDPVSYLEMILLEKKCQAIITDSGGLQKEAYFFHKPCITVRDETEWIELVDAGVNCVVGGDKNNIVEAFKNLQSETLDFSQKFYGNGKAGEKIVEVLVHHEPPGETNRKLHCKGGG